MARRTPTRRIRIRRIRAAGVLVGIAAIAAALGNQSLASSSSTAESPGESPRSDNDRALGEALPGTVWPADGQAAVRIGQSELRAGPNQHAAPIASVAKVMTAYLVLRDHPLRPGEDGPTITLTTADAVDTERRRRQEESVVSVAAGERLTERQALLALLLPSANNIAVLLARQVGGTVEAFVYEMNTTAAALDMNQTVYTDPSGFDAGTVSTATDQLKLAKVAAADRVLAALMATPSAVLPVEGTVTNTNALLGQDGFVGMKTGSDDAAGGCFMFRSRRVVGGEVVDLIGVVLGQHGHNLVTAGLYAAKQLVDRVARHAAPV
jgi:D-alanyl-D-alanine carboxypeptidase (penicillin-binding protein 5/6)